MKKMLVSVITAALLLTAWVTPAFSAVKTGDSCNKVGITAIAKGYEYKCVMKGKKKVWGKGIKVVRDAATTPTPTPTPSPSPTPTPKASPSPTLTLAQQWSATGSRAMEGYVKAFPQQSAQFPEIETIWRISDAVNPIISTEIQKQYKESIAFWSAYTKHEGVLQIIVGNLEDVEFVCRWRNSYLMMSDNGCASNFRQDKTRVWDAHTTQLNSKATDFYFMSDPKTLQDPSFWPRVPHEFFHNVQYAQTPRYKYILPCWAEEGGAEFFGIFIASQGDPDGYLTMRLKLILKLGTAGLLALYRDAGSIGWDKAIEKSFGKSKSEAYDEIAFYMKTEHDIGISQKLIRG